jgi:putative heme-binding domain-containing protein
MPGFTSALTVTMAWQTAAYVRSLGRARTRALPGNSEHGAAVYDANGCGGCHILQGRGNALGPELTTIGALRGAPYLRDALVKPEAAHPPGYLVVKATTTAGNVVRGIRVNEDVFYLHVRDARGTVHTLQKSDLSALDRGSGDGAVVRIGCHGDLDDLVAYREPERCDEKPQATRRAVTREFRQRRRDCSAGWPVVDIRRVVQPLRAAHPADLRTSGG